MRIIKSLFIVMSLFSVSNLTFAAPKVGDTAADFRLRDQAGEWHSLSDYKGQWVVLYFYPKDETPGCTTEACNFRDEIYRYRELGAAVLGVSLDDVESHAAFAEKYELPFPLLADTEKKASEQYDVLTSLGPITYADRQTFLIDPDGNIAMHYDDVDPEVHANEVLEKLEELMTAESSEQAEENSTS